MTFLRCHCSGIKPQIVQYRNCKNFNESHFFEGQKEIKLAYKIQMTCMYFHHAST